MSLKDLKSILPNKSNLFYQNIPNLLKYYYIYGCIWYHFSPQGTKQFRVNFILIEFYFNIELLRH